MTASLPALLVFLFPLAFSPGPGNLVFAANGARFGFRATLTASLGYHLATWAVTVALGLGFLAVLETVPAILPGIKLAGALYVLLIAWKMLRAGLLTGTDAPACADFRQGVLLLLLNPKAYVIIALMFSQFLAGPHPDRLVAVLLIATIFTANNLVAFSLWTLAGDSLARCFRSPRSALRLNTLFGGLLASVAIWMLLS